MNSENILNNLNTVGEKLFKSVETQVYNVLDNILYITSDIFNVEPLKTLIPSNQINGIIIITNSLMLLYIVYFILLQFINIYNGNEIKNPYKYIFKLIIIGILVNSSYFICKEILNVFDGISDGVNVFSKEIIGSEASFDNLKDKINETDKYLSNDLLSLNGVIKTAISFGSLTVLLNLSVRYVTMILLILISPLAILMLSSNLSSGLFFTWLRSFIINLSVQIFIKLILIIPLVYKDVNNVVYKIILVGSIYLIYKVNGFIKEMLQNFVSGQSIKEVFKE